MNNPEPISLNLPGLETKLASQPVAKDEVVMPQPRVRPVDRSQMVWHAVDLEQLIEEDHPARAIWALTEHLDLKTFYAPIGAVEGVAGRPAWDPRLLVSLWVYSYSRGIGSAREIARRCKWEPAFKWLCGMEPINYHTISDFRVLHGSALQDIFAQVLGVLSAEGLVSLQRVMQDGTKIKAFASADSFRREDRLQDHLEQARQQIKILDEESDEQPSRQQAARERAARERQQRLEQSLEELQQVRVAKHSTQDKAAARASTSDPQARVMKQPDGGYAPSYNVQLCTEASHKVIVAVGVSQNGNDYSELTGGVKRVEQNLGHKPQQVVSDGGYTCRENIIAMAAQGVEFIGSLGQQDKKGPAERQTGVTPEFDASAFEYHEKEDHFRCPVGVVLEHQGQRGLVGGVRQDYRAPASACNACAFKEQCCPTSVRGRSISRLIEEPEVRQFRQRMATTQAQEIYRQRAPVAEFPNAWLKEKIGLRQFRLRGLVKVGLETLWACLTYNIAQWVRLCWRPKLACT
jgi:transposase